MAEPIRVLVVGDHGRLRAGLAAEDDLEVVGGTADAVTARSLAAEHLPDVVVLDLSGPCEPVGAADAISRAARTKILLVNGGGDEGLVVEAIKAGAVGHLPASTPADEVAAGIREVHGGGCLVGAGVAARVIEEFAGRAHRADLEAPSPQLTGRELEVLELMAGRETNQEIARLLSITDNTVKAHQGNILAKLHFAARLGR